MAQSEIPKVTEAWGADGGDWSILVHGGAGDVRQEALEEHVQGCRFAAQEVALQLLDEHRPRLRRKRPKIFLQPFDGLSIARHRQITVLDLTAKVLSVGRLRSGYAKPQELRRQCAAARLSACERRHYPKTGLGKVKAATRLVTAYITRCNLLWRRNANRDQRRIGRTCVRAAGRPAFAEHLRRVPGRPAIGRNQNLVILALHRAAGRAVRLHHPDARTGRPRRTLRARWAGRTGWAKG